jgi:hypothetical protein
VSEERLRGERESMKGGGVRRRFLMLCGARAGRKLEGGDPRALTTQKLAVGRR